MYNKSRKECEQKMANDKREDVNAEKIYGHLCKTFKEKIISEFNVKEGGLTDEEVEQRRHRYGPNEVTQSKPKRWYNYLLKSLFTLKVFTFCYKFSGSGN